MQRQSSVVVRRKPLSLQREVKMEMRGRLQVEMEWRRKRGNGVEKAKNRKM